MTLFRQNLLSVSVRQNGMKTIQNHQNAGKILSKGGSNRPIRVFLYNNLLRTLRFLVIFSYFCSKKRKLNYLY